MSDKKYYWLKLKKDFFKRHDIRIIESMPNGKDYILFYLKLLVESVDHNGSLRFNDTIPYSEMMLSTITNTNVDIVKGALDVFTELKMIEILEDSTIYMNEVSKMLGTETYWADQKRKQRIGQCPTNVQSLSNVSNQEIDIDIEKELELEKDKEKYLEDLKPIVSQKPTETIPYQGIVDLYHELCGTLPRLSKITDSRKTAMKQRWKDAEGNIDTFEVVFDKVNRSDFLSGRNGSWTACNFDWIMKQANFLKIGEGNYDNKGTKSGHGMTNNDIKNKIENSDVLKRFAERHGG